MLSRLFYFISDHRPVIRVGIFVFSQIFVIVKSQYACVVLGFCAVLAIIVLLCQIYSVRHRNITTQSFIAIMKESKGDLLFAAGMSLLWLLSMHVDYMNIH